VEMITGAGLVSGGGVEVDMTEIGREKKMKDVSHCCGSDTI